jgi:hypothetical protein
MSVTLPIDEMARLHLSFKLRADNSLTLEMQSNDQSCMLSPSLPPSKTSKLRFEGKSDVSGSLRLDVWVEHTAEEQGSSVSKFGSMHHRILIYIIVVHLTTSTPHPQDFDSGTFLLNEIFPGYQINNAINDVPPSQIDPISTASLWSFHPPGSSTECPDTLGMQTNAKKQFEPGLLPTHLDDSMRWESLALNLPDRMYPYLFHYICPQSLLIKLHRTLGATTQW